LDAKADANGTCGSTQLTLTPLRFALTLTTTATKSTLPAYSTIIRALLDAKAGPLDDNTGPRRVTPSPEMQLAIATHGDIVQTLIDAVGSKSLFYHNVY
jgi:hypothetical protein